MKKKITLQACSSNPLDYPSSMSGYERDSLAAEAVLGAKKKKGRQLHPKTGNPRKKQRAKLADAAQQKC